ncbi:hypothetical protein [Chryseobacterium nepalense]|uniref:DUF3168 domain-containing protein n=1 Tax=Chryseobacterium nepalense TaxID=1854498 RepID=A0ABY4KDK6_9FLAO|nr:hypothetical protein [Chryseobacterium nepalense]UPQ77470.1 hypothetical protein M0D58_08025 [Chryseobacterium nepalense]
MKQVSEIYSDLLPHALCAILSITTSHPFKSPRSHPVPFYTSFPKLEERALVTYGLTYPVLSAGPGTLRIEMDEREELSLASNIREIISLLKTIKYDVYRKFMQNARLVQLSLINKREDFGLSYQLLVSSIESVA